MSEVSKDSCQSLAIVGARASLHSRKMIAGNLSGPGAENLPVSLIALRTSSTKKVMSESSSVCPFSSGMLSGLTFSGLLKAFWYCFWRMLPITVGSHWRLLASSARGPTGYRRLELSLFLSVRIKRLGIDLHLS